MGPPGHPPRTQARPSFRRSQSPIEIALHLYQRQTGEDILTQAIAVELQSCDSTDAALSLLERQSLSGDARLTGWLRPTVKVLHSLSSSLEKDVRLVLSPANVIFVAIAVLLSAAQSIGTNQDVLIKAFTCIEHDLQRLEIYTDVPSTNYMKGLNEEVILAVLSILTIVTREIKQSRMKKIIRRLAGKIDIKNELQNLDKLTRAAQMAAQDVQNTSGEIITPHNG